MIVLVISWNNVFTQQAKMNMKISFFFICATLVTWKITHPIIRLIIINYFTQKLLNFRCLKWQKLKGDLETEYWHFSFQVNQSNNKIVPFTTISSVSILLDFNSSFTFSSGSFTESGSVMLSGTTKNNDRLKYNLIMFYSSLFVEFF